MTVTLTSSLRIGLVSGTGVNFSAPAVPAITTDDIFNADNPSQTLTELIGGLSSEILVGSALVDGTSIHNYPMYTVPAGALFLPTKLVVYVTAISGSGNVPVMSLGWTSPLFNDLIDDVFSAHYALAAAGNTIFAAGSGYTQNDVLTLVGGTHTTAATVTVNTVDGSGHVLTFSRTIAGQYTVIPTNPVSVTGGSGSGFKPTVVWDNLSTTVLDMSVLDQIKIFADFRSEASAPTSYVGVAGGNVLTLRVPFVTTYSTYTFKALLFGFTTNG